jgi:hypothetical protein
MHFVAAGARSNLPAASFKLRTDPLPDAVLPTGA